MKEEVGLLVGYGIVLGQQVNETCCSVRCHGSEGELTVWGRENDLSLWHEVKWSEGERWLLMTCHCIPPLCPSVVSMVTVSTPMTL